MGNTVSGGLQVYNIDHNQITGTAFLGAVGSDWRVSGVGNFSSMPGESDVVMRNTTTGGLQVYNIANNQITGSASLGQVGLDWQLGGLTANPPAGAMGGAASNAQLVQAMAGFDGGAAGISNAVPLADDPFQQPLLTTPHA
jgi:hypothetical protein